MNLLIIRPQPGADATAALAHKAGIAAIAMPLFEVRSLPWRVMSPTDYDALIFTSANAPRHGGDALAVLRGLPVYAAGNGTAKSARAAGFGVIWTGTMGADAVIAQAQMDRNLRLLWLTGRHHHDVNAPGDMSIDVHSVYESVQLAAPQSLIENLSRPQMTALHSARAAQHFCTICEAHGIDKSTIAIVSFSSEISNSAGLGWAKSLIADAPNDDALLLKAKSYFTNVHRDP